MLTHVCITVDTEFSIAGAFGNAQRLPVGDQFVWCNVGGRSEGLGFLLETFKTHSITATFFVETLHRHYFKDDPMRSIAHRIADNGHEVQLHVHPCWDAFKYPDWRERARRGEINDHFRGRSEEQSIGYIQHGLETFSDWGMPKPQVFRSGSLEHDDSLYRALAKAGIPYSSNIGLAIFNSGHADYQLYSGCHLRHGVLECPVLTFTDWRFAGRPHFKCLTITGTSFTETQSLLEQANRAGISLVVILTHPFEYIQGHDVALRHARRHGVNQNRLQKLCEFLSRNDDRFSASGLAHAAQSASMQGTGQNILMAGAAWQSLGRMATQLSYEKYGKWALSRMKGDSR